MKDFVLIIFSFIHFASTSNGKRSSTLTPKNQNESFESFLTENLLQIIIVVLAIVLTIVLSITVYCSKTKKIKNEINGEIESSVNSKPVSAATSQGGNGDLFFNSACSLDSKI
jgi:hypothetical protein